MRIYRIAFLLYHILVIFSAFAQGQMSDPGNTNYTPDTLYTVQFFASSFPDKSFTGLISIGNLIREKVQGKEIFRYKIGNFLTLSDAKAAQKNLIQQGFTDAFINPVVFDSKVISPNPLIKIETELSNSIVDGREVKIKPQDAMASKPLEKIISVDTNNHAHAVQPDVDAQDFQRTIALPRVTEQSDLIVDSRQKVSILYSGKSLGVLGHTRFQEEHERVIDYAIKHDLEFKLVSHACWRAKGLTIFMPSDEPLGHELDLILELKPFWEVMDSIPALKTRNVILFQDPERRDLDMLEIISKNEKTDRQFPEIEPSWIRLYTCKIEDGKKCMIIEESSAEWPKDLEHWHVGEINRVDFGKIARLFEMPYNQGSFGARATIVKSLEEDITRTGAGLMKIDLGHRNGDYDLTQEERAAVDFEGLDSLAYELIVPFENELSIGVENLVGLKERFPGIRVVATNISSPSEDVFDPYVIVNHFNIHIGFIGLVDPQLAINLSREQLRTIEFNDAIESAQKAVNTLYKNGADAIIALSNMKSEDNARIAEHVKGIDIIMANLTNNGNPYLSSREINIPAGSKRSQGRPYFIATNFDFGIALGKIDLHFQKDEESNSHQLLKIVENNFPVNDEEKVDTALLYDLTSNLDRVRRSKGDLMFPAFVDIIEQQESLKDFDETTKHGRISKGLWELFIANLLRRSAPAELSIVREVPSFLPLIGKLHEREVRSWLWIEDHIVMMDLKGRDIARLLNSGNSRHLVTSGIESYQSAQGMSYIIMGRPLIEDVYYRVATTNVISDGILGEYFRFALRVNDQFIIQEDGRLKADKNAGDIGLRDYVLSELKRIRSFGKGKEHHRRIASLLVPETSYEKLFTFEFVRPTLWTSINRSYKNDGYESVPESRIISNNSFVIGAEGGVIMTMDGQKSAWDLGFHAAFAQQSASLQDGITQRTETMDDINVNLTYRFKGKDRRAFHPFARLEYDSEFTPTFNSSAEIDNPRQSILRGVLGMTKGFSPKWPRLEFGITAENDFSNDHYQYGLQGRSIGRFPIDREWRVVYTLTNNFNYFFPTANDTDRELSFKYNMVHEILVPLIGDLSLSVAGDLLFYRGKTETNNDPGLNLLMRVGLTYTRLWKPRFQSLF